MGQLIDGVWHDTWYDTKSTGGKFQRSASAFRNWLTADGAPGPTGKGGFAAEKDRYHLYVSLACPWAHRTLIMRKLKGLEPFISVSVVNPLMLENGWTFDDSFPGATGDTLYQHEFLYQLYLHADPHYSGRVTVPVLWDKKNHTIVSNESAEIIRMFNTAFDALGAKAGDYYPPALQLKIDELNGWIYDTVNNGVEIKLIQKFMLIERVAGCSRKTVIKGPAVFQHQRVHYGNGNKRFQSFELTHDQRAVCPRAGE